MNFITIFLFISAVCFIECLVLQRDCKRFKLKNGRIRNKAKAKLHRFFCNRDYQLVGEKYGYCSNGTFDISLPICVKPNCKKLPDWRNGVFFPFANGAAAHFYCRSNYKLLGNNMTYCDGENWVNNFPTCVATGEKVQLSCDFESSDICGWSDDLNHDVDWIRRNPLLYGKNSIKFDHTYGDESIGHFMALDYLARMNNTARLHSPLYSNMSSLCFTFYYHLFGFLPGILNVYIKKITEDFESLSPIFTASRPHFNDWNLGKIQIDDGVSDDFQIIFEAVRGHHYLSNIAIDDVKLSDSCPEDLESSIYRTDYTTWEDFSSPSLGEESCENRCDSNETMEINTCQCTDSCIENKTCCSDYIIVCGGWFSESPDPEWSTYSTESSTENEITPYFSDGHRGEYKTTSSPELPSENVIVAKSISTSTTIAPTKRLTPTTNTPTTNTRTPSTTKRITSTLATKRITPTPTTNTITPTTTKRITSTLATKRITPSTKRITPTTRRPIPPTKKLVPITIATKSTRKSTTTMKIAASTMLFNNAVPTDNEPQVIVDDLADPDDTFGTWPVETDYEDEEPTANPKRIDSDKNLKTTYPDVQFLSSKDKLSNSKLGTFHEFLLEIGISTLIGILFMLTSAIFVAKKYNWRCKNFKQNNRNTDSMSDVRFLTNEEVLDFTWRTSE